MQSLHVVNAHMHKVCISIALTVYSCCRFVPYVDFMILVSTMHEVDLTRLYNSAANMYSFTCKNNEVVYIQSNLVNMKLLNMKC